STGSAPGVVSGSKIGRHEPGSSWCSGFESESPNSSHSGGLSAAEDADASSESAGEAGTSFRSSCERTRTNGRAEVEIDRPRRRTHSV
ncbi:hypothetical protein LINPERPRIM_LOCUS12296, partial [Linum perenne]